MIVALLCVLLAIVVARARLRINWTDSLPRGLYRVAAVPEAGVSRDELVVACPPRQFAEIGRAHHYLLDGGCAGGVAPVLKRVAAVAGDIVGLTQAGLSVNGSVLRGTALLSSDRFGDPPAHVTFGKYHVSRGQVWLYTPKADGYDSRYFGPVATTSVLNVATPLLTIP